MEENLSVINSMNAWKVSYKTYNYTSLSSVEEWLMRMSQSVLTNMLVKILGDTKCDLTQL